MSKKFWLIIGTLLVVVVVTWIAISVYDVAVNVEINPNAEQHLTPIKPSFDLEVIEDVEERTKILPVSPKVIQELEYKGSSESPQSDTDSESVENDQNE